MATTTSKLLALAAFVCIAQLAYAADQGKKKADAQIGKDPAKKTKVDAKDEKTRDGNPKAKGKAAAKPVKGADQAKKKPAGKQDAHVKGKPKGKEDVKLAKADAAAKAKLVKQKVKPENVAKKKGDPKAAAAVKLAKADPKRKPKPAAGQARDAKKRHGRGEVKAIDVAAKTITLAVRKAKKQFEDKTISVADNVKVRINGETKTLADVQVGAKASVRLSEDEKTAVGINIGGRKKPQ